MYIYKKKGLFFVYERLKIYFFKFLTKNTMKLFFLGGDIINHSPMTSGYHEDHIVNLLKYFIANNYNNFLIDIGSNIGLISCQLGDDFSSIYMYEPNPLCCQISQINLELSSLSSKVELNNYGLGDADANFSLYIPKHNWGGAFICDQNAYTLDVAAKKDGFDYFDERNYLFKEISVKNAQKEFKRIFSNLESENKRKGVIKIDVEGYEPTLLDALALTIPQNISCYIVFESWDPKFDFDKFLSNFQGRAQGYVYKRNISSFFLKGKLTKLLYVLFFNEVSYRMVPINNSSNKVGDLVIHVDKKNA